VLIACVDGLKGFPDSVEAEYLDCKIQRCIVQLICNSLKLVPCKDYKAVTADLKLIYQATTEIDAQANLEQSTYTDLLNRDPSRPRNKYTLIGFYMLDKSIEELTEHNRYYPELVRLIELKKA